MSFSIRLATATVVIPDVASTLAMALPIPDDAPVTNAIFLFNDGIIESRIESNFSYDNLFSYCWFRRIPQNNLRISQSFRQAFIN